MNKGFFTKKVGLIILVIGFTLGLFLIIIGYSKRNNIDNSVRTKESINNDIELLRVQINSISNEINDLTVERQDIFRKSGFSEQYYELENKIIDKRNEKSNLIKTLDNYEDELFYYNYTYDNRRMSYYHLRSSTKYYLFGSYFILFVLFISISIFIGAKRKKYIINKMR